MKAVQLRYFKFCHSLEYAKTVVPLVSIMLLILSASAIADDNRGSVIRIRSQYDGAALRKEYARGTNHALVIGIDNYTHRNHPDLKNAVNDAQAVVNLLQKKYFFEPANIVFLKNERATKERIMQEFRDLVKTKVQKGDNIFIYYAGHGWYDETWDIGYWITSEASDPSTYLENTMITKFIAALDRREARHVLLVSDSCFSGALTRAHDAVETDIDDRVFKEKYKKPSRSVITSGGLEPVADGGKNGHSIFAYYFLKIMEQNAYPYLSGKQLGVAVEELVSRNSNQTPEHRYIHGVGDEKGQFFFINQHSVKISTPKQGDVSFDDILKQGKLKQSWSEWQQKRNKEYQQVKAIDENKYISAQEKAEAWRRFKSVLENDNPFSQDDDKMRAYAAKRVSHWQNIKVEKPIKTETTELKPPAIGAATKAKEINRDGRFIAYKNGTVKDTKSGLIWAAKDNGEDIDWKDAKKYCENYKAGGYTDWRLPTIDELEGIYDSNSSYAMDCNNDYKIHTTKSIHISCWRVWSSDIRGSEAAYFDFYRGSRIWYRQSYSVYPRVLPVRGGK
ncbi:caspase family protein [Desulfococcaceae bacterium HSG9]|nr:caspase family protein [Desulfococcaceae bacterium HSG9]